MGQCVEEGQQLSPFAFYGCCGDLESYNNVCVNPAGKCGANDKAPVNGKCCDGYSNVNGVCGEPCNPSWALCPAFTTCVGGRCTKYKQGVNCGGDGEAPINRQCCPPIIVVENGKCKLLKISSCLTNNDCARTVNGNIEHGVCEREAGGGFHCKY